MRRQFLTGLAAGLATGLTTRAGIAQTATSSGKPVRFIVGRFKNTFSRENLEACLEPLTLDRAEVLSYTPWGGTRDTGVAVWGNLLDATLQYRFMIADGRKDAERPADRPRLTARVHVSLWDPEYDYGYEGTYLGTKKVLTFGAAYDTQAIKLVQMFRKNFEKFEAHVGADVKAAAPKLAQAAE